MSSLSFRLQNSAVAGIQRHLLPVKRQTAAVQSKDLGCSVRQSIRFIQFIKLIFSFSRTILAIPTTLVLLSVVVDLLLAPCSENSGTSFTFCRQILCCFSPISNTQKLVRIEDTTTQTRGSSLPENTTLIEQLKSGAQQFHFLHGFRALSSVALVAAHVTATGVVISIAYPVQPFARHVIDYRANMRSPLYNALFNGGLLVHTFFLVSGLLLAYGRLSKVKMGFLAHGARRWLRYSPVMIGSICLGVSLELLGSGPLFHHDHLMVELDSNYRYWWTAALLYVHNLVPLEANVRESFDRKKSLNDF